MKKYLMVMGVLLTSLSGISAASAASCVDDKTFSVCEQEANAGDPFSSYTLANMHFNKEPMDREDVIEAYKWFSLAVIQGKGNELFEQFQMNLAVAMRDSVGDFLKKHPDVLAEAEKRVSAWTPPKKPEPRDITKEAALQGDPIAQATLGERYLKEKNLPEAANWTRKAADQGIASAQITMGRMYFDGAGVARDMQQSVQWFQKAAAQKNDEACMILAAMYLHGNGVQQNYSEAVKWVDQAAQRGNAKAQYNLGLFYAKGVGVAQDLARAYMWLTLAANTSMEQDIVSAPMQLAKQMTPEQIAQGKKAAGEWRPTK